jgi:hypothetical protein
LQYQSGLSTHDFGIAKTLALGKVLERLPSRVTVYGLSVGDGHWVAGSGDIVTLKNRITRDVVQALTRVKRATS